MSGRLMHMTCCNIFTTSFTKERGVISSVISNVKWALMRDTNM